MLKSKHSAGQVKLRCTAAAIQHMALAVDTEEVTSEGQFQKEIQVLRRVESLEELHYERSVTHQLDAFLVHDGLLVPALQHVALAESLQRIHGLCDPMLHELNGAKPAAAQEPQPLEVLQANLLGVAGAAPGRAALQRGEQEVHRRFIHSKQTGHLRCHLDCGGADALTEQSALSKDVRMTHGGLELCHAVAVLDHGDFTIIQDVERFASFPLLDNVRALLESHISQCLCHLHLLVGRQH
mmetsp:Transcript_77460/g.147325  ORF Transcript_77460/g.147325 Transcript_77460/m.147325 type:complete len:240 (-) Transcript_77460:1305-2024(-)